MLHDQYNAVGLLDQRKRVDNYADRGCIKNNIIIIFFHRLDKLLHTGAGKKLRGVRRNCAVGNGKQIGDLCCADHFFLFALTVQVIGQSGRRLQ